MRNKTPAEDGDPATPEGAKDAATPPEALAADVASDVATPAETRGSTDAIASPDAIAVPAAHAGRGLKIALISALAIVVALGVFIAFLMMRAPATTPQASNQLSAEPTVPAVAQVSTSPTPTPTPKLEQVTAQEPAAPPAPAPVQPVPAPLAPPALPDPPAPVIPITIDNMTATLTSGCNTEAFVTLAWTTTGAEGKTVDVNIRSGSGSPVWKHNFLGFPPDGSISVPIDCTRPIWYFKMTVSNLSQTKEGLLTFVNGKTTGWSWGNP